jgi:hypothetical protein
MADVVIESPARVFAEPGARNRRIMLEGLVDGLGAVPPVHVQNVLLDLYTEARDVLKAPRQLTETTLSTYSVALVHTKYVALVHAKYDTGAPVTDRLLDEEEGLLDLAGLGQVKAKAWPLPLRRLSYHIIHHDRYERRYGTPWVALVTLSHSDYTRIENLAHTRRRSAGVTMVSLF